MNINQWSLRSRLTIGIVLLSAIGFAASFYGTSAALKGYLIGQIDNELNSVVGGTAMRLDRGAVIQQNEDEIEDAVENELYEIKEDPVSFLNNYGYDITNFIDKQDMLRDLLDTGDYGETLNGYDGTYDTIDINGTDYVVMRIN